MRLNQKMCRRTNIDHFTMVEKWYSGGEGQKDKYKIMGKNNNNDERFELTKGAMNLTIPGVKRKINFLKSADGVAFYEACGLSLRIREAVISRLEELILELKY